MEKAEIKHFRKRWHEINQPMGKLLGYPDCCIKEFCDQPPELLKNSNPTEEDKQRFIAGNLNGKFSGFVPCHAHAKKIISGRIRLAELIKNRNAEFSPFPFAD